MSDRTRTTDELPAVAVDPERAARAEQAPPPVEPPPTPSGGQAGGGEARCTVCDRPGPTAAQVAELRRLEAASSEAVAEAFGADWSTVSRAAVDAANAEQWAYQESLIALVAAGGVCMQVLGYEGDEYCGPAIDWRARALAAEAEVVRVTTLRQFDATAVLPCGHHPSCLRPGDEETPEPWCAICEREADIVRLEREIDDVRAALTTRPGKE